MFSLVVDDFVVYYVVNQHGGNLIAYINIIFQFQSIGLGYYTVESL